MDLGIVYHIEDAHQFWAELADILQVSASSTLTKLDSTLTNFVSFCATYHEQYLQMPAQLEHACCLLLDSEIFHFHSERLSALVISEALSNTDPHAQFILHHLLLFYGRRHPSFLRGPKKWTELIPLLMDHILLVDVDCGGYNSGSSNAWRGGIGIPIESRLRTLAVGILYEVCRVQKFDVARLKIFNDAFIDHLFELVEVTRDMQDETLNYCTIKLIVALNEQFMVSTLQPQKEDKKEDTKDKAKSENRVMQILIRRLGSSKTFGENLIFMLNRADRSSEDRCMQLLILKILYLLFTTAGTQEYFYTNDLCVLVDVFIRELGDLDDDSESLRHTYLRVLHPLLTHTQLRSTPYKRSQILRTLESLIAHAEIRDVSPTTKRLVERCLSGSWAVQLKKEREAAKATNAFHSSAVSPISSGSSSPDHPYAETHSASHFLKPVTAPHPLKDERYAKMSRSVDVLTLKMPKDGSTRTGHHDSPVQRTSKPKSKPPAHLEPRRNSNESSLSLVSVAGAAPGHKHMPASPPPHFPSTSISTGRISAFPDPRRPEGKRYTGMPPSSPGTLMSARAGDMLDVVPSTPVFEDPVMQSPFLYSDEPQQDLDPPAMTPEPASPPPPQSRHRPAPAPPPKRRKPPAVPSRSTKAGGGDRGGTTMTTIASSKPVPTPVPSPLSRVNRTAIQ